jgi:hypothetical protein
MPSSSRNQVQGDDLPVRQAAQPPNERPDIGFLSDSAFQISLGHLQASVDPYEHGLFDAFDIEDVDTSKTPVVCFGHGGYVSFLHCLFAMLFNLFLNSASSLASSAILNT